MIAMICVVATGCAPREPRRVARLWGVAALDVTPAEVRVTSAVDGFGRYLLLKKRDRVAQLVAPLGTPFSVQRPLGRDVYLVREIHGRDVLLRLRRECYTTGDPLEYDVSWDTLWIAAYGQDAQPEVAAPATSGSSAGTAR